MQRPGQKGQAPSGLCGATVAQPMPGNQSSASHMEHHASPFLKGLFSGSCALVQRKHNSGPNSPDHGLRHKEKKISTVGSSGKADARAGDCTCTAKTECLPGLWALIGLQNGVLALPAISCVTRICRSVFLSFRSLLHNRGGHSEFPQHSRPFCPYIRISAPSERCHRPSHS